MAGAPRAASRFGFCGFISITRTIARGVTAMVVGSGALLGRLGFTTEGEMIAVGIKRHEVSHSVIVVARLGFHDGPFLFDLGIVVIHLVTEHVDGPTTDGSLVDAMPAK